MELIEGGSLAQQIQGAPQPVRKAAALVATLAAAVHAAHQSGIIHLDLKPANCTAPLKLDHQKGFLKA
jgi:eukaryotic-like serine/threonine-protein kinase